MIEEPRLRINSTPFVVAFIVTSGCFDLGEKVDGTDSDLAAAPEWDTGQWWRYGGSNGISYEHMVEKMEETRGFVTYRVRVNLSEPDELDVNKYTYWFDVASMGLVAMERGGMYGWSTCPIGPLFPITRTHSYSCQVTLTYHKQTVDEYYTNVTRIPIGWTKVDLPGGEVPAFEVRSVDRDDNQTRSTAWFSPAIENKVLEEGSDGVTYRLVDWGPRS